jgi:hypothetical protein
MFTTSGGSTGTGGTGTGGGAVVTSSAVVSSTSASSSTVSSSGAPAPCRLVGHPADCPAGQRCTVKDESSGATHCIALDPSPLGLYDACTDDKMCPAGAWCDHYTGVCKPMCSFSSDCPSTSCIAAKTMGGSTINGLSVCTAHCDPINVDPCGVGATCLYEKTEGDLDCVWSAGLLPGDPCSFHNDCIGGYVCVGTCELWCEPAIMQTTCAPGDCTEFANLSVNFGGQPYGYVCP